MSILSTKIKMKKILLAIFIISPIILSAQEKFELNGKLGFRNIKPGIAYLLKNYQKTDSIKLDSNCYHFAGVLDGPVMPVAIQFEFDSTATYKKTRSIIENIFLEPGTTEIFIDPRNFNSPYVKGSVSTIEAAMIGKEINSGKDQNDVFASFVENHPSSLLNNIIMDQLITAVNFKQANNLSFDKLDMLIDNYSASLKKLSKTAELKEQIAKIKATSTGNLAIDFTSRNTMGKTVSLSSFKGKYVLVDFWASWCGPCRMENPNVVEAYKKYRSKGFEILGVSLDEEKSKDKWLQAIKKDELTWPQVSDLKGFESDAAIKYGVKAIPANFLIDPNGIIVAKNLRGEGLDNKLAEIYHMTPSLKKETGTAKTDIGDAATDFISVNTKNKKISLSSYKGKYVLVDFWASWCKPCREENPNLLAAYKKYNSKGFNILSISLDEERSKDKWLAAIKDDNLPWEQVSDLKGWESEVAVKYGIVAIPANFLIDPKGIIIAKDLRGEALTSKLAEVVK
jgi:peroxiredoxin